MDTLDPPGPAIRLPRAAYDLARRLGASENGGAIVTLRQTGRMKQSIDAAIWTKFTAHQTISAATCAFDWRARMGPLGAISVRDALQGGAGELSVKALGLIPLAQAQNSTALTRGEVMRYLAELAWAPDAILLNTSLTWRDIDANTLAVSAGAGASEAEVTFTLDADGRIASGFAPDRPRSTTAPYLPTRWPFRYSDYRWHAGRWLPFAGEVAWDIDGDEIVYWQGRLEAWHA